MQINFDHKNIQKLQLDSENQGRFQCHDARKKEVK